jgi:branched-chain amino acid transport system ATP-binding protein
MLKATDLHVSYGDVPALLGVSFEVTEKEIVSIVGSNGAGKSTLLKAVSGILPLSQGQLEFLGKRIDALPSSEIVARGIIRVPEGRKIFPKMTVQDNLELGSYTRRTKVKRNETLGEVFQLFPILLERKDQIAGSLSGGEQQMLAIGRGLMGVPRLLMFDEPSLGLAPLLIDQIFETIQEINSRGVTLLLVEQNIRECLSLSHRGYVLEDGQITLQGEGKALLEDEHIRAAYLGI